MFKALLAAGAAMFVIDVWMALNGGDWIDWGFAAVMLIVAIHSYRRCLP